MKVSRFPIAVLFLLLGSAVAAGQRARGAREERAFYAPRYLHELVTPKLNYGARASGDLDDDGDLDLVVLEQAHGGYHPTGVQIWLNGGHGNFAFASLVDFAPWEGDNWGDSTIARFVFLADITGDGLLDLAYERSHPSEAVVDQGVLVHPGRGDGSFDTGVLVPATTLMAQFVVGDCDGDGDADLLVQESNTTNYTPRMAWWHFQGGSFVSSAGVEARGVLTAIELDGDGYTDAVMYGSPTWSAIQTFRTVNGAPTLDALISSGFSSPFRLKTGDLEGDGDEDLLAVRWDTSPSPNVFYFQPIQNDGTGFTALSLQSIPQAGSLEGGNFLALDGALADWDGDGDQDYVSHYFSWLENTGGAHFALAGIQDWANTSNLPWSELQVVDLNGDGHLDALADKMCWFGDGHFPARSSTTPDAFGPFMSPSWRLLEDWEGDGDLDLVDSGHLYLNNGDGTFVGRFTSGQSVPGIQGSPTEVGWGDFDGDGFRDRVVSFFDYPSEFEGMFLFTGTESGSYLLSPTVPSANPMGGVLTGDLDGDADLDILTLDGFWRNDGTGQFGAAMVAAYSGRPLLARDFDGDLDLDLLIGRGNALELLTNLGGLSFQLANLGRYVSSFVPALLDADQDGDLDLVIAQPTNGVVSVREQLPGGGFAAPLELDTPGVIGPVGQMDVDADDRLDLVVGLGGRLAAWFRGPGLTFPERREWMTPDLPRAFGDLDRDGDFEPVGQRVFQNFRFDGPEDGFAVQYALDGATSGTGGRHPILGSGGPVRPGQQLKLVISGGLGGASGVLFKGNARADVFGGGIRTFVAAPDIVRSFVLGGTPGAAGAGSIVLRAPVSSALVGLTFDYQVVLVDPGGSSGLSATNGLEIRYGDWPATR